MQERLLGPFSVSAVGLGCMNLSHAYGAPPDAASAERLLNKALDLGYTLFDTAALYGYGANESLLGKSLSHRRDEFVLASKCGVFKNVEGMQEINGHPEVLKKTCEDSLQRLRTDVIDLYYLHRWDKRIPIEESVGALVELVEAGKVRTIGLSEVSAETLRKAHAVHPISALQTEYSLWTRNPEIKVLKACRELGVTFVAFCPLARGFLGGLLRDLSTLGAEDFRLNLPRFQTENYSANLKLLDGFAKIARANDCSMAQLALAWILVQGEKIIPIPGTTNLGHLAQNIAASTIHLDAETQASLNGLINQNTVHGARYNAAMQSKVDTEEFNSGD